MSHYAKVLDGRVINVIVADDDFFTNGKFIDTAPGQWIQTSYNTRGNVHYAANSNTPDGAPAVRGNYAGIGFIYNATHDVFYPPRPFPSWTIDSNTWTWQAPIPYPQDGKFYQWDEPTKTWNEVSSLTT
jgi:hypothetical protein